MTKVYGIEEAGRLPVPDSKRKTGFAIEKVDRRDLNEILYKLKEDYRVGSQAQVTSNDANVWFDSSVPEFKDKAGATVTFLAGQTITWAGLDAISVNIDISTIDDLTHIMLQGVTLALGSQDLLLGENQRGELDISGTGTLTVLSSDGLRVKNSGLTVDNQGGDIFIDNLRQSELSSNTEINNLESFYVSASTLKVNIDSLKLLKSDHTSIIVDDISETFDMATDVHGIGESASKWYNPWFAANATGQLERKLVPDLVGTTDGTTVFKLVDSTADFVAELIKNNGAIAYNTTTNTKTKVTVVDDLNTLSVEDDIFPSGDNYLIRITAPTFSAGYDYVAFTKTKVYNDSGSDFVNFKNAAGKATIENEQVLTAGTSTTQVAVDLYSAVPIDAKECKFALTTTSSTSQTRALIAPTSSPTFGAKLYQINTSQSDNDPGMGAHGSLYIREPQKLYYDMVASTNVTINITEYEL